MTLLVKPLAAMASWVAYALTRATGFYIVGRYQGLSSGRGLSWQSKRSLMTTTVLVGGTLVVLLAL